MQEYILNTMSDDFSSELEDRGFTLIEQEFKGEVSWLIYSDIDLLPLCAEYGITVAEVRDVADTGWDTLWRDYLEAGWLTEDVFYCFDEQIFDDGRAVIRINPAFAFGTGGHATTRIAAKLLSPVANGVVVMDVGTGSGILSIFASLKGAATVFACDNDAMAVENAKENIALNNIQNIDIWAGVLSEFAGDTKIDVVVANIITSVLSVIHSDVLALKPNFIIYSGILISERDEFLSSLDLHGYEIDDSLQIETDTADWCGVRFKRV